VPYFGRNLGQSSRLPWLAGQGRTRRSAAPGSGDQEYHPDPAALVDPPGSHAPAARRVPGKAAGGQVPDLGILSVGAGVACFKGVEVDVIG
jgi:hypothetical protein